MHFDYLKVNLELSMEFRTVRLKRARFFEFYLSISCLMKLNSVLSPMNSKKGATFALFRNPFGQRLLRVYFVNRDLQGKIGDFFHT